MHEVHRRVGKPQEVVRRATLVSPTVTPRLRTSETEKTGGGGDASCCPSVSGTRSRWGGDSTVLCQTPEKPGAVVGETLEGPGRSRLTWPGLERRRFVSRQDSCRPFYGDLPPSVRTGRSHLWGSLRVQGRTTVGRVGELEEPGPRRADDDGARGWGRTRARGRLGDGTLRGSG